MKASDVIIVVSRCATTKASFGCRLEETARREWNLTWAFALPPERAQREGYDRAEAKGSISVAPEYPGCPGCGSGGLVLCARCDRLGCWDRESRVFTCPWCTASGPIGGQITRLSGGGDL